MMAIFFIGVAAGSLFGLLSAWTVQRREPLCSLLTVVTILAMVGAAACW